ncbi:MAG: hypothetical protein Q9213_008223 [Squamulea squamosa]
MSSATMISEIIITDPDDPLNQRFRNHFARQDSTLCNFLDTLDKRLLHFLRSLLMYQAYGVTNVEPAVKEILRANPTTITRILNMDCIHLGPSNRIRHFLNKCLDRPTYLLDVVQLQCSAVESASRFLQQVDWAVEQNAQATFKLRFSKVTCLGILLPRLNTLAFDGFVTSLVPNATPLTNEYIHQLASAGFRYDYMCRDEEVDPYSNGNDGYLFLLPESISHYQWEHDLLHIELPQTRQFLHDLGLKETAYSFPGSLHNLARGVIDHYMSLINWRNPPVPSCSADSVSQSGVAINAIAMSSNPSPQSARVFKPSSQLRPANSEGIAVLTTQQHPPQQEPNREVTVTSAQQVSHIAGSNQRRGPTKSKRRRSPAPSVPAPALASGSQQADGLSELEPPPKLPRILTDLMRISAMGGQVQQIGVSQDQQQQAPQYQSTSYMPRLQQHYQVRPSTSVIAQMAAECELVDSPKWAPSYPAGPLESNSQQHQFPLPVPYPPSKIPANNHNRKKSGKGKGKGKYQKELEKLRLKQQQEVYQQITHGPPVSEIERFNSTGTATWPQTSPTSTKSTEQQQQIHERTSGSRDNPVSLITEDDYTNSPSYVNCQPQTSPTSSNDPRQQYIDQCYGFTTMQEQEMLSATTSPSLTAYQQTPREDQGNFNPVAQPTEAATSVAEQAPTQQQLESNEAPEPAEYNPAVQIKQEQHTPPASPVSDAMDVDSGKVEEKRGTAMGKELPLTSDQEQEMHVIEDDDDDDKEEETEEDDEMGTVAEDKQRIKSQTKLESMDTGEE